MELQPYLSFDGRCEEAIEFYRKALGAEVQMLMRFKDSPDPQPCPGGSAVDGDKVMHACLQIGATSLMLSDGMCSGRPEFKGFSLSIAAADAAEADRLFGALGDGGQISMPLAQTFFAARFGMVSDRFGVSWMIIVAPQQPA